MPTSAIVMLVFTSVVLFGGIGICMYVALKKK
ncbi:MAG: MetS family NSS transporter small subunit [candidate division Zixibacteria bacterium]|nr:MetS family NSS transporter small subunit [candidate division Zixibacteria bacterium]